MSTIKQKIGTCKDCPPGSADKTLIAGRCSTHYWRYRADVGKSKKTNVAKVEKQKEHKVFFASQVPNIPVACEECNAKFHFSQSWMVKAAIAHILPKAIFESIAIHPQNRWFGCLTCHADYDNRGEAFVVKMKIYPRLKRTVQDVLIPLLTKDELRRVPQYFL